MNWTKILGIFNVFVAGWSLAFMLIGFRMGNWEMALLSLLLSVLNLVWGVAALLKVDKPKE